MQTALLVLAQCFQSSFFGGTGEQVTIASCSLMLYAQDALS